MANKYIMTYTCVLCLVCVLRCVYGLFYSMSIYVYYIILCMIYMCVYCACQTHANTCHSVEKYLFLRNFIKNKIIFKFVCT